MRINYTTEGDAQIQLCANSPEWHNILNCTDLSASKTVFDLKLTAQMITDIEADKLYIQGKNFTINNVQIVREFGVAFDESTDNTIEEKTCVDVTLKRTMKVDKWNTFCVPFSIDATQIADQFGEGTQVAEYKSSDVSHINFATTATCIEAGKAYLVKPTKAAAAEKYTFNNVNITALKPVETVATGIAFRGIYNPTYITVGLQANTFAAGIVDNVVMKAAEGSKMNAFRAFFIIPAGNGSQSSYMLSIDGTATSINAINGAEAVVDAPVYNIQGQRVDGNNLTPGIYVKAGKKFVVK